MHTSREPVVVVVKLKDGWRLDPEGTLFRHRGQQVVPCLPIGARLRPALRIDPPPHATPAERELLRFVHLHWPDAPSPEDALALARSWPCVERAELPLSPP